MDTKVDRYEGIDGVKAYAIIGIALMHILTNGEYRMGGFVFERMIPSFTNLVFLFYDGQWFWNVLRLLPEIQGSENWCSGFLQKTVQQDLAIFRIALCAGLRNVTQ